MGAMNYRKWAIDDLQKYRLLQRSLDSIPERIGILEAEAASIHAASSDKEPVRGGTSTAEDRLIDNISDRVRARESLAIAQRRVRMIEKGLAELTDDERLVLHRFYIDRHHGHVDRLCEELCMEQTQVYNIKNQALEKYTAALFGVQEL